MEKNEREKWKTAKDKGGKEGKETWAEGSVGGDELSL